MADSNPGLTGGSTASVPEDKSGVATLDVPKYSNEVAAKKFDANQGPRIEGPAGPIVSN